jgi:hypothetical protein
MALPGLSDREAEALVNKAHGLSTERHAGNIAVVGARVISRMTT